MIGIGQAGGQQFQYQSYLLTLRINVYPCDLNALITSMPISGVIPALFGGVVAPMVYFRVLLSSQFCGTGVRTRFWAAAIVGG